VEERQARFLVVGPLSDLNTTAALDLISAHNGLGEIMLDGKLYSNTNSLLMASLEPSIFAAGQQAGLLLAQQLLFSQVPAQTEIQVLKTFTFHFNADRIMSAVVNATQGIKFPWRESCFPSNTGTRHISRYSI
jgi:hypothetical protein